MKNSFSKNALILMCGAKDAAGSRQPVGLHQKTTRMSFLVVGFAVAAIFATTFAGCENDGKENVVSNLVPWKGEGTVDEGDIVSLLSPYGSLYYFPAHSGNVFEIPLYSLGGIYIPHESYSGYIAPTSGKIVSAAENAYTTGSIYELSVYDSGVYYTLDRLVTKYGKADDGKTISVPFTLNSGDRVKVCEAITGLQDVQLSGNGSSEVTTVTTLDDYAADAIYEVVVYNLGADMLGDNGSFVYWKAGDSKTLYLTAASNTTLKTISTGITADCKIKVGAKQTGTFKDGGMSEIQNIVSGGSVNKVYEVDVYSGSYKYTYFMQGHNTATSITSVPSTYGAKVVLKEPAAGITTVEGKTAGQTITFSGGSFTAGNIYMVDLYCTGPTYGGVLMMSLGGRRTSYMKAVSTNVLKSHLNTSTVRVGLTSGIDPVLAANLSTVSGASIEFANKSFTAGNVYKVNMYETSEQVSWDPGSDGSRYIKAIDSTHLEYK